MPDLVVCKFHKDHIKTKQAMHWTKVQYRFLFLHSRASNNKVNCPICLEFELILSWWPASYIYIWSKVKTLPSGQLFVHYRSLWKCFNSQCSMTINSKANSSIWPEFEHVWDRWLSSLSASFRKIRLKLNMLRSEQDPICFRHSMASKFKETSPIWPAFKTVHACMLVQVLEIW